VFLPFLKRHWGIDINLKVKKRGYWPKGGGEVQITIPTLSKRLTPIQLTDRGKVSAIHGYSYCAGLPGSFAKSMANAATSYLIEHATAQGYDESSISIRTHRETYADAIGSGSGIVIWAETENGCILGGSSIGSKGKDPQQVGHEAAEELITNLGHGGCVDEYLQDQLIIFLALAEGTSTLVTGPLTLHTKTAIWIAELLTPAKFTVTEEEDSDRVRIVCQGMGFVDEVENENCK